jgi:hypothetical protein
MIGGYINNPKQLSKEMQLCIAAMAEKQARIAELGFPLDEKNWCKLIQGQILIQALEALELLSDEEQKSIINSYNNLMVE